jgi:iron-sulfur cluster repair protein YtfE (RIC family)
MKRSEALTPLSHEHHHALFVAQKLRNATPQNAAAATDEFLAFWRSGGEAHFQAEEEILFPAWSRRAPADHESVVKLLVDHVELRRMAADLASDPLEADELHVLGERLHDHVRYEERVFFPLVEQTLPAQDLERILDAFEERAAAAA